MYASNTPAVTGTSRIFCRYSTDGGTTWSAETLINDDPNTINNNQWMPAPWCDKETGRLYVQWMDTRDCPTSDSCYIYGSYSTDGGSHLL
ncbi:MAG: sialidase family protein [Ignavibacteria bacterium]